LEAKDAVSFFIGIQIGYFESSSADIPIHPHDVSTMLTNSQTHERMSITMRQTAFEASKPFRVGHVCLIKNLFPIKFIGKFPIYKLVLEKMPHLTLFVQVA
jgi:hypothetical protein